KSIYGVVIGSAKRTYAERERQRLARIGGKPSGRKLGGKFERQATENLAVRGGRWCCVACTTDLGSAKENYKAGCVRLDRPIEASNPIVGDPSRFIDPRPQFRQFCCPGCGRLIENEIAVEQDPLLRDVEIA
ncbi:MAG TPA: acetone carboxylase subunit gamma, partial [Burkholderiales bacterium]|nr:acetone carboxylase subunit gamma [Burkholderiales bacterium]